MNSIITKLINLICNALRRTEIMLYHQYFAYFLNSFGAFTMNDFNYMRKSIYLARSPSYLLLNFLIEIFLI